MSVGAAPPIGRLVRSADFERVLSSRTRARSVHFALHHVAGTPSVARKPLFGRITDKLSTGRSTDWCAAVDDSPFQDSLAESPTVTGQPSPALWLGVVVPKRHARRAVTRTLLKRQIKAAVATHVSALPAGLWVVRLRAGFDRADFPSAASSALRRAARDELDRLFAGSAASRIPG